MIEIPLWLTVLLGLTGLALVAVAVMALTWQRKQKPSSPAMPDEWALTGRAVFSTSERRIYRTLRETLPNHVVLAKLPLVRFCQPIDFGRTRYWYDLLGTNYVSFAICAPNGRVLAAIDIDKDRNSDNDPQLRRSMKIKRAVLRSCRIRYLRTAAGKVLSESEIIALLAASKSLQEENPIPRESGTPSTMQFPADSEISASWSKDDAIHRLTRARESLASTVASRRAQRNVLWQESTLFQDSFFALDSRLDESSLDDPSAKSKTPEPRAPEDKKQDLTPPMAAEAPRAEPPLEEPQERPTSRPGQSSKKRNKGSSGRSSGRRKPPVVKVTLEDMVPSDDLNKVVQLDAEEARYAAGQS